MAISARDITGSPFGLNDVVLVRAKVTAVTSAAATPATSGFGGSADSITVTVDTNGLVGERTGVTFTIGPTQCRRAQGGIQNGPQSGASGQTTTLGEHDPFGSPFSVGDEVLVRGLVTSIVSASTNAPVPTSGYGGSADPVTVLVDTNGLPGEVANVSFVVSPVQCRRGQGKIDQGPATTAQFH